MKNELHDLYFEVTGWCMSTLQSPETYSQSAIIAVALGFGWLIRKVTRSRIKNIIDGLDAPIRIKNICRNMAKLVLHATALFVLVIFEQLSQVELINIGEALGLSAAVSLLLAWIFIRVVAQLIRNPFMRQMVATFAWIFAALSILGILDDTTAALDSLALSFGDIRISAFTVIKGVFALFILVYGALFFSGMLERRLQKIDALTISTRVLLGKVIRVVLVCFALIAGLSTAGIDLSLLTVFSGALGLGVGFGLQKGISNLFSGMMLLMDRSITPGDIIELQNTGTFGWVKHMGARYTEIVTRDNKSFIIPNEDFITQQVVNWSHGDTLVRMEVKFGVHYDSDPHEVIEIAKKAATNPERVAEDPAPVCWIVEFGDSSINFALRFWIRDAQNGVTNVKGQVLISVWDGFKEHDIKIPYPHREVFIRNPQDIKSDTALGQA